MTWLRNTEEENFPLSNILREYLSFFAVVVYDLYDLRVILLRKLLMSIGMKRLYSIAIVFFFI